ncbi:unnamed protein product [Adineta steineri]|uniref:BZIP domain-containing protein n=1 Tax=Adineta steineri TaxID=433720 RepID=A0A815KZ57_9BILA|nr:unnamed protein product [Adineta steineri]CAF1614758.1 unnamed protein product [Adineta steineri]
MSVIKLTNKSLQPGHLTSSGKITCIYQPGKNDHTYAKVKYETIEELENNIQDRQQADDKTSSTAAVNAAIMKIKSELKILCSLQVPISDKSSTSTFNTEVLPSQSSDYTNLEPSFELPFDDNFFEEIVNNIQLPSTLDDDWPVDFPIDSIDRLFSTDSDMTFKELTDMSMEQEQEYFQHIGMNTDVPSTTHDETTTSTIDSVSDDNERDDINRRGLKKSGGPVRKLARFGNKQVIKYSDEYHDRRVKNNDAVKKSRMKAKEKQKETECKMTKLSTENRTLSDRVDLLMKELQVLKSLYKELNQDLPTSAVQALERVNVR